MKNLSLLTKLGITAYATAALVYFSEVFGELTGVWLYEYSWEIHELVELVTVFGLIIGAWLMWRSQRLLQQRNQDIERHLRAAQGEFFAMVDLQFSHWELSAAEKDVAILTVKGMTIAEIAQIRNTSEGTVKSQNNAIYRKAGVKNRTQLLGALIEDLLVDPHAEQEGAR